MPKIQIFFNRNVCCFHLKLLDLITFFSLRFGILFSDPIPNFFRMLHSNWSITVDSPAHNLFLLVNLLARYSSWSHPIGESVGTTSCQSIPIGQSVGTTSCQSSPIGPSLGATFLLISSYWSICEHNILPIYSYWSICGHNILPIYSYWSIFGLDIPAELMLLVNLCTRYPAHLFPLVQPCTRNSYWSSFNPYFISY